MERGLHSRRKKCFVFGGHYAVNRKAWRLSGRSGFGVVSAADGLLSSFR